MPRGPTPGRTEIPPDSDKERTTMQTNETEGQTATIDAPAKDATRLFVYGMLKRGYPLGDFISRYGATFVREAVLDDHTLRGGGIACMRPFAGGWRERCGTCPRA
jgi:hypothetical protein